MPSNEDIVTLTRKIEQRNLNPCRPDPLSLKRTKTLKLAKVMADFVKENPPK